MIESKLSEDAHLNDQLAADQLILEAQSLAFPNGLEADTKRKDNEIARLLVKRDAFRDKDSGMIRAAGRLKRSDMT